ncbi:hypothetical protein QQG55_48695 [Brugia pahangi]
MLTLLGERTTASLWVSPSGCLLLHCHDVYSSLPLPPLLATAPVQTPSNHLQEFRHFRFLLPSLPIKLFVGGRPTEQGKICYVWEGGQPLLLPLKGRQVALVTVAGCGRCSTSR